MAVNVYLSKEKIEKRVKELASEISKEFGNEELIVIGVLNGSFIFCADLIRHLTTPVVVEFMAVSSYGAGTVSSGNIKINMDLSRDIEGKNVLLVEDIVDTGHTISTLKQTLLDKRPKKFKFASLLFKPARLVKEVEIDYLGFEIEDKFVIGYGLDYDGRYRELPYIGVYSE